VALRHYGRALIAAAAAGALATVGIFFSGGTTPAGLTLTAAASSEPVYTVMNTSETPPDGVWFRNSPHTADTDRVTGHGVYMNEQVRLECYAWGDAVGPYNNQLWYFVLNVTRPVNAGVANQGYLNAHYINDGAVANQIDAGVVQCGSTPAPPPLPSGGSLYYSPYPSKDGSCIEVSRIHTPWPCGNGWVSAPSPATVTMYAGQWYKGSDCTAGYAVPNLNGSASGKLINTLAGWSYGRNGPIMFLEAGPTWQSQIHYILLFDPGSLSDYRTGVCDAKYPNKSFVLANWLAQSPANRLVVLAGAVTADYSDPVNGHAHAGIQNYLFPAIRTYPVINGRSIRKQVVVCNYDGMSHANVWINFKNEMNKTPITLSTCPTAPGYSHVVSWNP
jgi:hypothetical protein